MNDGRRPSAPAAGVTGRLGLDLPAFATSAIEILHQALPFTAACLAPADPATELITTTVKYGGLTDNEDDEWAYWEYEADELGTSGPWPTAPVV